MCYSTTILKSHWLTSLLWASYQIRKIAGGACSGNAGNGFPRRRFQWKLLVSDPGMHHGPCVTHVPWCMTGSLTCGDGENVPGIPGACAPAILRIWQEAHGLNVHVCCSSGQVVPFNVSKLLCYSHATNYVRRWPLWPHAGQTLWCNLKGRLTGGVVVTSKCRARIDRP